MDEGRAEDKFTAGAKSEDFAVAWLSHVCLPDSRFADGWVHSIYFDTRDFRSWEEKINSAFFKTKVRVRWYDPDISGDPSSRTVFLEAKFKKGASGTKLRKRSAVARRWLEQAPLCDDDFTRLLGQEAFLQDAGIRAAMVPVVDIRYRRRRFVCPQTLSRVCVDSCICVDRTNASLLPAPRGVPLGTVVVEIKGTGASEPGWVGELYERDFRKRSFSKYDACLRQVTSEEGMT